jgi:type I restriction enzyme, S subunit
MSEEQKLVPKGWIKCSIGDVAYLKNGFAFKSSDYVKDGTPVIRISDIQQGEVTPASAVRVKPKPDFENFKIAKDDILVAMSGATTGKFGIYISSDVAFQNQRVGNIKRRTDAINQKFLFYFLYSAQKEIEKRAYGGAQPNISSEKIESISFLLPPANEQKRVVAKIEELFSELDSGIESLKSAREQLKVYRQAVLKHAFEGKLTASWRDKNKDKLESADQLLKRIPAHRHKNLDTPTELEIEKFPVLPKGWKYARLGYFIDSISAGKSFKCDEREPTKDEIGVAKVSAVTWGEYDEHESKTCIDSAKVHPEYFIQSGDFLFSRANTIELVGACVIARTVTKRIMLSDKTLRIKFGDLDPYYFLHYLRSQMARNEIMERSTGNQDSMRNIGQDRIRNIIVPVCSAQEAEIIKQHIEEKFSVMEHLQLVIDTELQKSEALRQSILKKAFSGQLVAQNPADEPASLLLERIRSEKATPKPTAKKPKEKRRAA